MFKLGLVILHLVSPVERTPVAIIKSDRLYHSEELCKAAAETASALFSVILTPQGPLVLGRTLK